MSAAQKRFLKDVHHILLWTTSKVTKALVALDCDNRFISIRNGHLVFHMYEIKKLQIYIFLHTTNMYARPDLQTKATRR